MTELTELKNRMVGEELVVHTEEFAQHVHTIELTRQVARDGQDSLIDEILSDHCQTRIAPKKPVMEIGDA